MKTAPRPFVKWVGGKRQLLDAIRPHVPKSHGTYYEPFVGGGALFFSLRPKQAVLSDVNERLVRTYTAVRDSVDEVIALLKEYPYEKRFFLKMRDRDIDACSDSEVAAWFIYLNKTSYNGLYRVNSQNRFNVPFGRYSNPLICDEKNLRACSKSLKAAKIVCEPYDAVLKRAKKGDFVYFDPPYVPLSATSYFTSYTANGFSNEDQIRLRDVATMLKARQVTVLLSNSSAPAVVDLYKNFKCTSVLAARAVNAQAKGRGRIEELLIS